MTKADQPDPAERIAAALEKLSRDTTLIMNSLEELVRLARRANREGRLPPGGRRGEGPDAGPVPLRRR